MTIEYISENLVEFYIGERPMSLVFCHEKKLWELFDSDGEVPIVGHDVRTAFELHSMLIHVFSTYCSA